MRHHSAMYSQAQTPRSMSALFGLNPSRMAKAFRSSKSSNTTASSSVTVCALKSNRTS